MAEAALDDVFIDDITLPAADGYPLGATLFLPRGAKRHAVLINSATAVPRKIYRGFAGYLARRGCAVLTYDYRGTGDSRQKAMTGYNQPKSLVGFKASMSDWAAQDVTSAVHWMRERYKTLPLAYVGHSFGGQALGLLPNNTEISRALFIAAQAGYWKLMAVARALSRLCDAEFRRRAADPHARLHAGLGRPRRGHAEGRVPAMGRLGDERALSVRRLQARRRCRTFRNYKGALRALCFTDDPWATRPAVELLCSGFTATKPEIITITPKDTGASKIGHFGFFRPEHRDTLWRGAAEWIEAAE